MTWGSQISNRSHSDEAVAYLLCQRFFGRVVLQREYLVYTFADSIDCLSFIYLRAGRLILDVDKTASGTDEPELMIAASRAQGPFFQESERLVHGLFEC